MKSILIILAVCLFSSLGITMGTGLSSSSVAVDTNAVSTAAPPVTSRKPVTTETQPATTTTTTKQPTTKPTTQPATTTKPTTEMPTTTAHSNSSTTETPTTPPTNSSSTSIPITTEKPTPAPKTQYIVVGPNGIKCVVMTAELSYTYKNMSGSIYPNATLNGTCGETEDKLSIKAPEVELELVFFKNKTKKYLKKVVMSIDNTVVSKDNLTALSFASDQYFVCKATQKIALENSTLTFKNLTLDIFRNSTDTSNIGSQNICVEDMKISSIVPIAVGAALAGLVITVLIAYLIGRKRSRRGYESV
ncbi:hypothetical protein Ahia01_000221300 [Argonauta hians]